MNNKPELLFFDSNIYINLFRFPEYQQKLDKFLLGAYLYVINKIVIMELWAGARTKMEENILNNHMDEFPLIGLADDNFILAGQILYQMRSNQIAEPKIRRRLRWDILIALSARDNNAIIVTENHQDFKTIQRYIDFEFLSLRGENE